MPLMRGAKIRWNKAAAAIIQLLVWRVTQNENQRARYPGMVFSVQCRTLKKAKQELWLHIAGNKNIRFPAPFSTKWTRPLYYTGTAVCKARGYVADEAGGIC